MISLPSSIGIALIALAAATPVFANDERRNLRSSVYPKQRKMQDIDLVCDSDNKKEGGKFNFPLGCEDDKDIKCRKGEISVKCKSAGAGGLAIESTLEDGGIFLAISSDDGVFDGVFDDTAGQAVCASFFFIGNDPDEGPLEYKHSCVTKQGSFELTIAFPDLSKDMI